MLNTNELNMFDELLNKRNRTVVRIHLGVFSLSLDDIGLIFFLTFVQDEIIENKRSCRIFQVTIKDILLSSIVDF
jgi:hypothetical protein